MSGFIRLTTSLLLFALLGSTPLQAQEQSKGVLIDPERPEQALDFMLGTWRVKGRALKQDGTYSSDSVSMRKVTHLFDPQKVSAILIEGYPPKDGDTGESAFGINYFETHRVFVFHNDTKSWRGIGHNTLGNRKWLDGHVEKNSFYFDQTGELFRTDKGIVRFTYHSITTDSYSVRIDYSPDDGTTWRQGTYLMDAERVAE